MTYSLLWRDRLLWGILVAVHGLVGLAAVIFANPLVAYVATATSTNVHATSIRLGVGAAASLLAALAAVISIVGNSPRGRLPLAALAASAGAAGVGVFFGWGAVPWWALAAPSILVIATAICAWEASRRVRQYQSEVAAEGKSKKRSRRSVRPELLRDGVELDWTMVGAGGAMTSALGILGVMVLTQTSFLATPLPEALQPDGQVVVGQEGAPQLEILYGLNYPHMAELFGDEEGALSEMVENGDVQLTTQGISLESEVSLSYPIVAAQACAWEVGGAEAAMNFTYAYSRQLREAVMSDSVPELVRQADFPHEGGFIECVVSEKYEAQALRALMASSGLGGDEGVPQVYVDGEHLTPESLESLLEGVPGVDAPVE